MSVTLSVQSTADALVLLVRGTLDDTGGRLLLDGVRAALDVGSAAAAVEVDLRRLDGCTHGGLRCLASCAGLGREAGRPIRFRVGHSTIGAPGVASDGGSVEPSVG